MFCLEVLEKSAIHKIEPYGSSKNEIAVTYSTLKVLHGKLRKYILQMAGLGTFFFFSFAKHQAYINFSITDFMFCF